MKQKDYFIPILAIACIIALVFYGPIPQDQQYHFFADARKKFGIPNFLNVITNLPFLIIGLGGLAVAKKAKEKELRQICVVLFSGFLLLTFGSGYYHWIPNNISLVYDRLPMVIIFMSFFSLIIYDHSNRSVGYRSFISLTTLGLLSVLYWIWSEQQGYGDLRWYAMVQFFPLLAIPLILLLYKSPFNYTKYVVLIFLFFILAKIAEHFDEEIYLSLNKIISGHSLKHLFMAAAEFEILIMLKHRITMFKR